jgi:hypothetical protein
MSLNRDQLDSLALAGYQEGLVPAVDWMKARWAEESRPGFSARLPHPGVECIRALVHFAYDQGMVTAGDWLKAKMYEIAIPAEQALEQQAAQARSRSVVRR